MKILLADDHAVVRQGLKLILADHFKKAVFGQARNATEALFRITKEHWDVLVLDITMPGRSGLEILQDVKRLRPKLPVLVLSMHPEDQFAVRMLKAGAGGYMTKESADEELVGAIQKVVSGGRQDRPSPAARKAADLAGDVPKGPPRPLPVRALPVFGTTERVATVRQVV